MSATARQLAEDRALRDSALRLVKADLDLVRNDLAARSPGQRAFDRVADAALDTLDDALDYTKQNKGQVAAGVSALLLLLFRGPLLDLLAFFLGDNDDADREQDEEPA